MGKKRKTADLLPLWFKHIFGSDGIDDGYVELRVFPNGRGQMVDRAFIQDATAFSDFVAANDGKDQNVAIYYGPFVRARKGGTKNDLGYTNVLWAEIDTDKIGWDHREVARHLHDLPYELQPSACVHSGHGLHCYWHLQRGAENGPTVEGVNKLLRDMVSGDNVQNADRILRVPWSWNTKAKPVQSSVIWSYPWHKRSLRDIHDAVAEADLVLDHDGFITRKQWQKRDEKRVQQNTDPEYAHRIGMEDRRKTTSARGLAIWKNCKYGGGPGYVGLDEAIMLYTAHAYCRLSKPTPDKMDVIVRDTLSRVREVKERDAPDERWDWNEEERHIRQKLMRWKTKWDGMKNG